jgi:Rps23 Pro-64 3,4-dihydroxylase Tpa1-like proline 4-hydroxylase
MTEADPVLNPALKTRDIAHAFARDRRAHIPDILTAESAARVHRCLAQETEFATVSRSSDGYERAASGAGLSPGQEAEMMTKAYTAAREDFHYLYDNHPMSHEGEPYPDPSHYLAAITRFLNSAPVLNFARGITGSAGIDFAEAQATRYRAGHFLNLHDDHRDGKKRVAAYVLNMTPNWRLDWGGALLFLDWHGQIAEGYAPAFNALNILAVPQPHMVGFVSPFAGASRYSITGWFRSR